MADFITEYFINPIKYQSQYAPYNAFNTVVYALIGLGACYLIYKALRARNVGIDSRFFYALLPFVFFGSLLRVYEDAALLPRTVNVAGFEIYPFVTPYIYVLTFLALLSSYLAARMLSKDHYATTRNIGIALAAVAALGLVASLPISASNSIYVPLIAVLAVLAVAAYEAVFRFLLKFKTDNLERIAVFAQAFDGAATFAAVSFAGYGEQHVLANAIFTLPGGPLAFFAVKTAFSLLVIYALRKESSDEQERIFVLSLVMILGLAPGIRDTARLAFGV